MKRNMKLAFKPTVSTALAVLLLGCAAGTNTHDDVIDKDKVYAKSFLNNLVLATDFDELVAPLFDVRKTANGGEVTATVALLLSKVDSTDRLAFHPNWDSDNQFAFCSLGGREVTWDDIPNHIKRVELGKRFHALRTVQDLEILGGRCAWALERLLGIGAPPFHHGISVEMQQVFRAETECKTSRAMANYPQIARFVQLSDQERLELAMNTEVFKTTLFELMESSSDRVQAQAIINSNSDERIRRRDFPAGLSNLVKAAKSYSDRIYRFKPPVSVDYYIARQYSGLDPFRNEMRFHRLHVKSPPKLDEVNKSFTLELFDKLLSATDFDSLLYPIRHLRENASLLQIWHFISVLLEHTNSTEALVFNPNFDHDWAFHYSQQGRPAEEPGKISIHAERPGAKSLLTIQDLEIAGGRCAWALERLLGILAPPLIDELDHSTRKRFCREIEISVRYAYEHWGNVARFPQLWEIYQTPIAGCTSLSPGMLYEMSLIDSDLVAAQLVLNPNTPADLRELLLKNKSWAVGMADGLRKQIRPDLDYADRIMSHYILQLKQIRKDSN